jgi:hypothetical protein
MIPTSSVAERLGLASVARLKDTHAVRIACAWHVRSGTGWAPATAEQGATLEANQASWTRCGRGWRVATAPAQAARPLGKAALASLIRDAVRTHPECIRRVR